MNLRKERWSNGFEGDRFVCIEMEVPDDQAVLSDFHLWHYVLNRWPISSSQEESEQMDEFLEHADQDAADAFFLENWKQIFDITPNDEWISRGEDIQATFWELKKEYIMRARIFVAASKRKEDIA